MANAFDKTREWRKLLNLLGRHLTRRNIETLIFLEGVPDGLAEEIARDGHNVLSVLEDLGKIDIERLDHFKHLMQDIQRSDLKKYINEFQKNMKEEMNHLPGKHLKEQQSRNLMKPGDFSLLLNRGKGKPLQGKHETKAKESTDNSLPGPNGKDETRGIPRPELRMKSSPCGICLIISNENFDSLKNIGGGPQEDSTERELSNPENDGNAHEADDLKDSSSDWDRKGTEHDEVSLEKTFKWLGFTVIKKRNCTRDQMFQNLKEIADMDHSKFDAFVCCIMTHGSDNHVYGTDWVSLSIGDMKCLFNESCPSLQMKPKIFFIQACRGQGYDRGYFAKEEAIRSKEKMNQPNKRYLNETKSHRFDATKTLLEATESNWDDKAENSDNAFMTTPRDVNNEIDDIMMITTKAATESDDCYMEAKSAEMTEEHAFDANPSGPAFVSKRFKKSESSRNFLFAFPSTQGNKALNTDKGSWFISTICKVFQEHAHEKYLNEMLHMVGDEISKMSSKLGGSYTTRPEIKDSLHHDFVYFNPIMSWKQFNEKI